MTKTVLIVDDSTMMRAVLADLVVADETFEVIGQAANGAEAIDQARELDPDLILLDIEMPVMDGIEALKRLSLFSRAKVIVVSSIAQIASPQAVEARRLGAADVVGKPSGALSLDLDAKRGHDILKAARRTLGLT